ncbi:MAG: ribonuclease III family protein [Alphaproteobacteria bacterium]|nr:ribonuclease III family protein [Alphaproteobacteria bacterium]
MPAAKVTDNVSVLESIIDHHFGNEANVSVAINHPGSQKYDRLYTTKFERLEFLGDRVLGLSLAKLMYEKSPKEREGELAVRMSVLAGTDFLIDLAKKTKMIDCFSIPKDMFVTENKTSSSIADMVEAVIGSVFLDSGFEEACRVVSRLWRNDITKVIYKEKDSKTRLQEISQSHQAELPVYRLVKMTGEAHDPVFEIEVTACGFSETGVGRSKKNAEHDAAEKLLEKLKK